MVVTGLQGSAFALATFMMINSITPGPNNIMLLQGGLKKGYWGCRHHMLGIGFGVSIMLWLSYWGMSALIVERPIVMTIIRTLGTAYLLWLACQMAKSDFRLIVQQALQDEARHQKGTITGNDASHPSHPAYDAMSDSRSINKKQRFGELPLSFWEAAVFQWLNPKAWTMTMVAPSLAMLSMNIFGAELGQLKFGLNNWPLLLMCVAVNFTCISFWAAGGQWLRKLVNRPTIMRWIHVIIVLMVVYCAVALWL